MLIGTMTAVNTVNKKHNMWAAAIEEIIKNLPQF